MKAVIIATIEQLRSIGIPCDGIGNDDFGPDVKVTIINDNLIEHPQLGTIAEVEYLYKNLNYSLPIKWLKMIDDDSN